MLICKKYLSGFWEKIRQANKKLQTEIYKIQKKVAEFVRRHRTIKLLHLFRKYSAFAVVVSSATLVSVTNMAAEGQSGGLLSGQWKQNNVVKNDVDLESEKAINNELAPVSVASRAVNPDTKDDEKENLLNDGNGKIISAPNSPVLKDPEEDGGVKIYTVKEGDTVSSIAAAHHITVNTILWANDIENVDSIMPGDKIFILPVAGLTHIVKKGENLDKIAKEF
ncbi:MAG TPA: LysM domain-containing protein, partial [Candidatus Moranbacteria bacterium]|nr:LysM domain-containing protein [Candidatus Moranbacteria bacterium]